MMLAPDRLAPTRRPTPPPPMILTTALALAPLASPTVHADGVPDDTQDWVAAERGILENHVQLTHESRFRKAGECYFSPDGTQIVFQAIERMDDPAEEEEHYQMYVADLVVERGRVTGIENVLRLSPPGSSSTCGWSPRSWPLPDCPWLWWW